MNVTYPDIDDEEEDYFRSLDALLLTQQTIKSILGASNHSDHAQPLPHGVAPSQQVRASAGHRPQPLLDPETSSEDELGGPGGDDDDGDDDEETEPSSEPESEAASDGLEVANAAARGVLDAEADIAQLAAEVGVPYGTAPEDGRDDGSDAEGDDGGAAAAAEDDAGDYDDAGDGDSGDGDGAEYDEDDDDDDLESYIVRPPGEELPPGSRLERLYAALDTNRELQRQMSVMLERLDSHSNTSYLMERRVREQRVASRPRTAEERAAVLQRAAAQAAAAAGAPPPPTQLPQTSRFWRVAGVTPAPSREWSQLAAAQQLPLRPYDRVRWPSRVVDALNKGLKLEVQALLTKQLLDRIQQQQQQQQQGQGQRPRGGSEAGAEVAAGGGEPAAAPGPGSVAAGSAVGGPVPTTMQTLQEQLKRIADVWPDSPEAIPLILRLDEQSWDRVAASHRVGRSGAECAAYYRHNLRPGLQWPLEESRQLMELAEKYGKRHWDQVAAELGTGRTPGQCLAHCLRWSRFDRRPSRSAWSAGDDQLLKALVAKYGTDWVAVAEGFGGRFDRHQVRDRWHGVMTAGGPRRVGKWTAEEDEQLTKAVDELGQKWKEVACRVAGRTARQCRERYVNLLSPGLKFGPFSEEEQRILATACRELQAAYGRIIWSRVAERLPGRTDDQCSRAYEGMVKHDKAHIGHKRGGANHELRHEPTEPGGSRSGATAGARAAKRRKRGRDADGAGGEGVGGGGGEEGGQEGAAEEGAAEEGAEQDGAGDQEGQQSRRRGSRRQRQQPAPRQAPPRRRRRRRKSEQEEETEEEEEEGQVGVEQPEESSFETEEGEEEAEEERDGDEGDNAGGKEAEAAERQQTQPQRQRRSQRQRPQPGDGEGGPEGSKGGGGGQGCGGAAAAPAASPGDGTIAGGGGGAGGARVGGAAEGDQGASEAAAAAAAPQAAGPLPRRSGRHRTPTAAAAAAAAATAAGEGRSRRRRRNDDEAAAGTVTAAAAAGAAAAATAAAAAAAGPAVGAGGGGIAEGLGVGDGAAAGGSVP
ncbi:hypothetical protein PLESTB_000366500 [Pleodorina starrii]|uniref:Uncharacterized protein n=1 Tax=Pleodorina starrii TaxID=330485 RepID=A0A9W6EYT2_9CHLO|nr:hypothetical protein PLESTM_000028500 [Pleodorina starrii]GLC50323.1 hypothetical protein PLESTB_000366500 [Pleodorina starrii]GLC64295.1 hypothetical protein PLESTF_000146300 [Pleodorina starrii]